MFYACVDIKLEKYMLKSFQWQWNKEGCQSADWEKEENIFV